MTTVQAAIPPNTPAPGTAPKRAARTCVGCGASDDAAEMVHVVVVDGEVVFDTLLSRGRGGLRSGAFGRGAHVHPRPACLAKAPAGLARTLKRPVAVSAYTLGERLVAACERRMAGLLASARRLGAAAIGADAAIDALKGGAPLAVVAVDAGSVVDKIEVTTAIAEGRAIAWRTKADLGRLLGHRDVAICAVRHDGIASELKKMRACADAGAAAMAESAEREGARCRRPEAR